ncbi:MAG: restriction endonuclease subunit S [Nodularia sp. CChRGM 3473]
MKSIPSGWSIKPLGEVATLQRGFDLPVNQRTPGDVPVFAANGQLGTHNIAKVKGPGVVTGRSGTLGEVHFIQVDYWPLNTALWVKDFHGNDPKWVARLLKWMRLETHTRGTGVPTLNRNLVHVVPVLVPPLEEQRRIAAILDKADAVRRKRKEAIALTEELLRSAFLDMFGDPVTNPKGWEVRQLGELAYVTDGAHKTPTYLDSGIPFLSAKNVKAHKIDWDNTRFISKAEHESLIRRCYPKRGDVLLTKSGTIGEVAVVDRDIEFSLFESVALLRLRNGLIDPIFLATLLNDHRVRSRYGGDIKGVAVKHLHLVDIKRLAVIVPHLEIQNLFLQQAKKNQEYKTKLVQANQLYDNLFNSLLQKAFRGEL